jgi:WD40 repeat protein
VIELKWSPDGTYLGSSSFDKSVKIAQLESSGSARVVQTGTFICVHDFMAGKLWSDICVRVVPVSAPISQICWHPTDSNRFLIAGDDKSIELWDVRGMFS